MIQPLRIAHRRVFVTLAFVLPSVLLLGLGARRPNAVASATTPLMPVSANVVTKSNSLGKHSRIRANFYRDPAHGQYLYVVLKEQGDVNEPDLLLYWSSSEPQGDTLPADARFIGDFADGKPFLLEAGEQGPGHLILFSLAHHSVFDTAVVEKLP